MSSEQELIVLFEKVAEKARSWGIVEQRLKNLPSVQSILNSNNKYYNNKEKKSKENEKSRDSSVQLSRVFVCGFVLVVVVAFAVVICRCELYNSRGFTNVWFAIKGRNFFSEQCTIEMPNVVQDIFRPPVRCSMCRNIEQVDVVSAISPSYFQEKYAYTGRPVVITDATQNWSALETFSFDFLKSLYVGDESLASQSYFRDSCQFFPYRTEFRSLSDFFEMSSERSQLKDGSMPWYVGWSNCDSTVANILRQHYDRPYFLPADAESSKTDWIFMGSPGYGAHMHIDHVGNPSWQAQISGQKKWTLVPPPECAHVCRSVYVTVKPGEIIVLDTNSWFHQTQIVGDEMSITIGSEYD